MTESPSRLEQQWRELCQVAYDKLVREYGNDGPPEHDLPTDEQRARMGELSGELSEQTDLPADWLWSRAEEAADLHGRDPGTDYDPDRFAAPDWDAERAELRGEADHVCAWEEDAYDAYDADDDGAADETAAGC